MNYLLDSNIIIYASKAENEYVREFIKLNSPFVSFVSVIEVMGFNFPSIEEKEFLEDFFQNAIIHLVTNETIKKAVLLKQNKKIALGDLIIAATAIENNLTLVTHNTKDFNWIENLSILDPIKEK